MAKHAKPRVHGRDHEHGGADPTKIHYDDVGSAGPPTPPPGIRFGTENTGNWLHITTTTAAADGYGTKLAASGASTAALGVNGSGGAGVGVDTYGDSVGLKAGAGAGGVGISSSLTSGGTAISAYTNNGTGITVSTSNGTALYVEAIAGTSLLVLFNGVEKLRVDSAGVHVTGNLYVNGTLMNVP